MDIEKAKEFFHSIPIEELSDEIRKRTGLSDLIFNTKIKDREYRLIIEYDSQDIVEKVGFLKLIFRELRVKAEGLVEQSKAGDELVFWCTVDMDYYHPGGGHNGFPFLYARYTDKTGWHFEEYHGI